MTGDAYQVSEHQNGQDDEFGPARMLERRETFSNNGIIVMQHEDHHLKGDEEPNYCARNRILFHLGRLLKDFPFFSELEDELLAQLPEIVSYAHYPAESVFFREGDAGDQCYILLTGQADVWKEGNEYVGLLSPKSCSEPPSPLPVHSGHSGHSGAHEPPSPLPVHSGHSGARRSKKAAAANASISAGSLAIQRKCQAIAPMLAQVRRYSSEEALEEALSLTQPSLESPAFIPDPQAISSRRRSSAASLPPMKALLLGTNTSHSNELMVIDGAEDSSSTAEPKREVGEILLTAESRCKDVPQTPCSSASARDVNPAQESLSPGEAEDEDECAWYRSSASWSTGTQVASLLSGSLFGELALLKDQPRNATVVCASDCEVLTITKNDFVSILKTRMSMQESDKLDFLRRHVPGMQLLDDRRVEDLAYFFKPSKFPKNHFFAKQGGSTEGFLFFLVKGSVEFRMESSKNMPVFSGLPEVGHRRLGCLAPGGMFGSLYVNKYEPFSIVATTSPCDVYRLSKDDARRLPESILRGLRGVLEDQRMWRVTRCDSTAGNILGIVPQTLPSLCKKSRKSLPKKALPAELRGLLAGADIQWDMAPGEIIALKGQLPRSMPHYRKTMCNSTPLLASGSVIGGRRSSSRPGSSMSAISRPMTTPSSSVFDPL
jgi:CRP-like cAMP-binding protein